MSGFNLINSYDDAWKAIIMPPRQEYEISNLGSTEFNVRNNRILRSDLKLINKHGHALQCSFYQQQNIKTPHPCVVYLHANGSSRIEAVQYANIVLGYPLSFFSFDFTACGKSEGTYSSVGWFEQDDLDCVIKYLENSGKVSKICLWGRSMGATTALLYCAKFLKAECLILDSPFANFKKLCKEIVKKKTLLPSFITTGAYSMIRKTIQNKANFDIDDLRPIKHIRDVTVPALFGVARNDTYVPPQHTQDLHAAYIGEKRIEFFDGDHNSGRSFVWLKTVQEFLTKYLLCEKSNLAHKDITSIPNIQIRSMKFTWLDSNPPSNRSKLSSQDLALSKKTSKTSQADSNESMSSRQRYRGVSAASYRPPGDTTTPVLSRNPSKLITQSSMDMKTDHDDPQEDTYVKPQLMWQCDHQKTMLGPKLVSSRPGEESMHSKNPLHNLYSYRSTVNTNDEYSAPPSKNINIYHKNQSHNNSFNMNNLEIDIKDIKGLKDIGPYSVQNSFNGLAHPAADQSTDHGRNHYGSFLSHREEKPPQKQDSHRAQYTVNRSKTSFKPVEKLSPRVIQVQFDPKSPIFLQNPRVVYPTPSTNDYGKPLSPNDSLYSPNVSRNYDNSRQSSGYPQTFSPETSFRAEKNEKPSVSAAKVEPKVNGYSIYEGYGFNKKRISLDTVLFANKSHTKGY